MSRKGAALALVAGTLALGLSRVALATPITVEVVEDADGATIQIRGEDGKVREPRKVVTSEDGALFFIPEGEVAASRIETGGNHRLKFVQVGSSRTRTALKLRQRDQASGKIASFVTQTQVPGGYDIRVADHPVRRTATKAAVETKTEVVLPARVTSLAALDAELADPLPAPPAAPETPVAEEERPFLDAAVAPEPQAPGALEAAPEPTEAPQLGGALGSEREHPERSYLPYLGIVALGLVGAGIWWRRRQPAAATEHEMEIVSRIPLAPRQQIMWIRAGGRQFLVGATDQRIALLTELGTPPTSASAPTSQDPRTPAMSESEAKVAAFKARLQRALGDELRDGARALPEAFDAESAVDKELPEHLRLLAADAFWPSREDAA